MRQRRTLVACFPIAFALLSGCSSERSSQAAPLPPVDRPSATATPSSVPSPASPPASPEPTASASASVAVPVAAMANTPQGAGAFTRFYFDELIKAYLSRDTRAVRLLAAESCGSCAGLTGGIDAMRVNQRRVTGPPIKILSAETPGFGYGPVVVDLQYTVPAYDIVDVNDKIIRRFSAQKRELFLVSLVRVKSEWLIGKIQVP